jgi:type I restriction enzyme R subunit
MQYTEDNLVQETTAEYLGQNPLRTDFKRYYEEIVAEYNREKDPVTIEQTFEALRVDLNYASSAPDRQVRDTEPVIE